MAGLEGEYWVSPSKPVPAEKTVLPPCDQIGQTIILPRIACFKIDAAVLSEERLVEALKTAIADTTAEYPHLCGKVTVANAATRRYQLEIPENDKLRLVVKRHALNADELEAQGWPFHKLKRADMTFSKYPIYGIDTFNFGVQCNLIEGGVLLAIHMNHIHLDGIGHVITEQVFAHHLGRAIDRKPSRPSGIITAAALDKSLAWGKTPARPILEWEDWRQAGAPFVKPEGMSMDDVMDMLVDSCSDLTGACWKFSPAAQEKIKKAGQPPNGQGKLSLASCMHSFLWKLYVKARQQERGQELDTPTTCFTPVQTRGRIKSLPQTWSGFALVYSRAPSTIGEVLECHPSELGKRMEDGIARWTEDSIREYWGSIEQTENLATIEPNVNRQRGTDVEMSNLSFFPFHTLKWGTGLQVKSWRITELAFTDAYIVICPKLRNGDLEFFLLAEESTYENILRDPEFRSLAEFVCHTDPEWDSKIAETAPAAKAKL